MNVVLQEEWSDLEINNDDILRRKPKGIILHHTAFTFQWDRMRDQIISLCPGVSTILGEEAARSVQNAHRQRGWRDIGYNFFISREGIVYEGRKDSYAAARTGRVLQGAHAGSRAGNRYYWGVCLEGNFEGQDLPLKQRDAMVELCAYLSIWGKTQAADLYGHRDFKATACPGKNVYTMMETWRKLVREKKIRILE